MILILLRDNKKESLHLCSYFTFVQCGCVDVLCIVSGTFSFVQDPSNPHIRVKLNQRGAEMIVDSVDVIAQVSLLSNPISFAKE